MSIHIDSVAKSFGDKQLFTSLSFRLARGRRAALVGRNGSGKSTLLRMIAGLEPVDAGTIHSSGRKAYLDQGVSRAEGTVLDTITPHSLSVARARLEKAEQDLSDPTPAVLSVYAEAEERYRLLGGYDFHYRAEAVLDGLALDPKSDLRRLSGGQRRRAMLAALLLEPADVLLLDEPTNHLDLASREWLEGWLRETAATVLVVSHDRTFLDNTVTQVLELERGRVGEYPGNYTQAMELKRIERTAHERAYAAQERKKRALRAEMGRLGSMGRSAGQFNYKRVGNTSLLLAKNKAESVSNTYAKRAKALETRLERMDEVEKPFEDGLSVTIPLPEVPSGPEEVLVLSGVSLERGGLKLLQDVDFALRRGEKVALVGPNGCGKSSLLSAILGRLPFEGTIRLGHELRLFQAGQHGEELAQFETIEDAVRAAQPALRMQDLYYLLGRLGLPGPDACVSKLSGGERNRLALARLAVTRASLLVLDEPTNDLDLEAVEAVERLLAAYPGSILFASHDRRLIENVAHRVWWCGDRSPPGYSASSA